MNQYELWEKALKKTEIIRPRILPLLTFADTILPYISLSESVVNKGDTVIRKGEITVGRPSIILPPNLPQFEGFSGDDALGPENFFADFFLMRGIRFPSLKYSNNTGSLDIHEGSLESAVKIYSEKLKQEENTASGLVIGPEDCWQFSLLILAASQMNRSAESDIQRILEEYRRKNS